MSNGVFFNPNQPQSVYVATTFGLLVSPDSCHYYWLCEQDLGYGGEFDPNYAVTAAGTIIATTFQGVRISRDGGCSFTTQLDGIYASSLSVGPTGDIWVGSSDTAANNAVFLSQDDGQMFAPKSTMPASMWFPSIATARSDPDRVYVVGYQIANGGLPPSAHLFRSDDHGVSWPELDVSGVALASMPTLVIAAVDPNDANTFYVISRLANPPYGDLLYRTTDGGATFGQVFATTSSINAVVIRSSVYVTTQVTGLFTASDGVTFTSLTTQMGFGCLNERDGTLYACASDYPPGNAALVTSSDGMSWSPAMQFEYLTGPLDCPVGTAEHDICAGMFYALGIQLGAQDSQCSLGSGFPVDAGPRDGTPPPPKRSGGCCDAGSATRQSAVLAVLVLAWVLRRPLRRYAQPSQTPRT